jgi:capsular polysaccharide transport system permease protein
MIKNRLLLYWFKKIDKEATLEKLQSDKILYSQLLKKYNQLFTRAIFALLFFSALFYIEVVKSELYESSTAVMVKDLNKDVATPDLGLSLLGAGSSSQLQDSMVIQEYLNSLDMLLLIDKKFNLIKHYESSDLDIVERLSKSATQEDILAFYQARLNIFYDETSSILHISFAHTNPAIAQEIVRFMIKQVEFTLNEFNRKKAKKQLTFIEEQHAENKKSLDEASILLEDYQNKNLLLDPKNKAEVSSAIIAELENKLMQKRIELQTKKNYLNANNYELTALKSEIKEIKRALLKAKERLTGSGKNKLNKVLFEYERLKMRLEFALEVYKTSLVKLESAKLDTIKSAKTLTILIQPNLPDGYTYPNKPKAFITLLIVMFLIYGIFSMLYAIIKDHKE